MLLNMLMHIENGSSIETTLEMRCEEEKNESNAQIQIQCTATTHTHKSKRVASTNRVLERKILTKSRKQLFICYFYCR